jgi:hypothetical protein
VLEVAVCTLVVHGRGWAGQVIDLVHFQQQLLHNVVAYQLKVCLAQQVCHVLLAASEEVVHADHLTPKDNLDGVLQNLGALQ